MKFKSLVELAQRYAAQGIIIALIIFIILFILYFFIFRNILKKNRSIIKIKKRRIFWCVLLMAYLVALVGITMTSRMATSSISNLHLFYSYKEAINTGLYRYWLGIIGNIILFMPLGFLVPLAFKKLRNEKAMLFISLISTLILESVQYLTGLGIFDIDDIFNNFVGSMLGYASISILLSIIYIIEDKRNLKRKVQEEKYDKFNDEIRKDIITPNIKNIIINGFKIFIVFAAFTTIFICYNSTTLGNLPEGYKYRINLKNTDIILNENIKEDIRLDESIIKNVYVFNKYTIDEARDKADKFFKNLGYEGLDVERIDEYDDGGYYYSKGDNDIFYGCNFIGDDYEYYNFSLPLRTYDNTQDDEKIEVNTNNVVITKEMVLSMLEPFDLYIPNEVVFKKRNIENHIEVSNDMESSNESVTIRNDSYILALENDIETEETLTIGEIRVTLNDERDKVRQYEYHINTLKKLDSRKVYSKIEILTQIKEGKIEIFNFFEDEVNIDKMYIESLELIYSKDSKGYFVPVYEVKYKINDDNNLRKSYMGAVIDKR